MSSKAEWLAPNNFPNEVTQVLRIWQFFGRMTRFSPIVRETFITELEVIFNNMVNGIVKLVEVNHMEL